MKTTSNDSIDKMIADALGDEDRAEFEALGEPTIFEQIAETFRGRTRWLNGMVVIYSLIFATLFGLSIFRFFHATEVRDLILWASASVLSIIVIGLLKLWYWMELNRVTVLREIKRLELQVARLAAK
ncbi:MAG: hypothetical protein ACI9R3_002987 [Verrucomicrobiales bacterium]|jgi:hypothetical protein